MMRVSSETPEQKDDPIKRVASYLVKAIDRYETKGEKFIIGPRAGEESTLRVPVNMPTFKAAALPTLLKILKTGYVREDLIALAAYGCIFTATENVPQWFVEDAKTVTGLFLGDEVVADAIRAFATQYPRVFSLETQEQATFIAKVFGVDPWFFYGGVVGPNYFSGWSRKSKFPNKPFPLTKSKKASTHTYNYAGHNPTFVIMDEMIDNCVAEELAKGINDRTKQWLTDIMTGKKK